MSTLILPKCEWSLAELVAEEEDWDEYLSGLTEDEKLALLYDWHFWARPKQIMPDDDFWRIVFLKTGRGFGKTLTGAQRVRERCEEDPRARFMLVGPTRLDVRETMIEGETGILQCCPPWYRPEYRPSRLRLRWKRNGKLYGLAQGYSADKPDRLRGGNWTDVWGDEFAAWDKPEAWKNIRMALRKGRARCILTSTPKTTEQVQKLLARGEKDPVKVRVIHGSSRENASNLTEDFWEDIRDLEGTNFGRQEIDGEVVDDNEGALFRTATIQRWPKHRPIPPLLRRGVALDPADSLKDTADEFGIVAGGCDRAGKGYVTADKSGKHRPEVWSRTVLDLAADGGVIILEAQNNANNLQHTLRSALRPGERLPQIIIVRAGASKAIRAGPAQIVYEAMRMYHLGYLPFLEQEMTTWIPGVTKKSPNRLDALVWLILYLFPNVLAKVAKGFKKTPEEFWTS